VGDGIPNNSKYDCWQIKKRPIQRCFRRELVVGKALRDVVVVFDAEYLAPQFDVRELVVALQYHQRRLQRRLLLRTQYHAAAADEIDVQV